MALHNPLMKKSRGMALILAMLIAALAATVAVTLIDNQMRWMQSVEERRDYAQAKSLTVAGIKWAAHVLNEDARQSDVDHLLESWAYPLPATPIENGTIEGQIIDLQSKININDLLPESKYRAATQKSLARLSLLVNVDPAVFASVFARFSEDRNAAFQQSSSNPRAKKAVIPPMFDVSELAAFMPAAAFKKLSPFLVALPEPTALNINTAPREAIAAFLPDLTDDKITEILEKRPYRDSSAFRQAVPNNAQDALTITSDYFYVTVRAQQNAAQSTAEAILRRKGKVMPETVWRTVE